MVVPDRSADDKSDKGAVVKPLSDKLQYRFMELPNKLQAMVISDPETDKGAAAMDVRVGSFSDPDDIAGLAHFTEHMLFYASEKYPEEDEYNKFCTEHGGSTNAFTAAEHTNYHFHVNWDHLPEALDRFSQFFLSPLISADGVDREIKAVDSEHSKNINSDPWRNMQLWKHLANPEHPFHKFATGNLRTLQEEPRAAGIDVHAAMKDFYAREYSANLMRLVVYGRESLEELQDIVQAKFAAVPNADLSPLAVSPNLTDSSTAGALARMVPVGESSIFELSWVVPPEYRQYRFLPCHYLSHLIGHEGPGSVFQFLKGKKWVTGLSAGESGLSISSASLFSIRVELTDDGQEHVYDIIAAIFQYIMLLRGPDGVSTEIYNEMKALAEMNFNFSDKRNPYSVVTSISSAMQMYPTEHTLLGMYDVPMEFNETAINEVLNCLTPQQVRMMWSSKRHAGKLANTEPIYGTPYEIEKVSEDLINMWATAKPSPELFVPKPNPFIPTDFSIVDVAPGTSKEPEVVSENDMHKLWFMPDQQFKTPKAYMYMNFVCAEAYHTPQQAVLSRMWVKLLNDYLNALVYPAELAGLDYSLGNSMHGFQLVVYGYNHKLKVLLEKVLEHILEFAVKEDRFQVCKEQLTREYANMKYEQPYQRAMYQTSMLCEARRWHIYEYQDEVKHIEAADLELHHKRLLTRCFVEAMVIGNVSRTGATELMHEVTAAQEKLKSRPLFDSQRPEMRIVKIPQGLPLVFSQPGPNPENENSSIVYTFQVEANDMRTTCLAQLLVQIGSPAAYSQLRTVEQLGYIVFLISQMDSTVMNLRFIIQSSSYSAQHMQDRIDAFLPILEKNLADMDASEFAKQVEELSKAKLEKPKRLATEAGRLWREISGGTKVFDRPFREVAILRKLQPQDLSDFFHKYVLSRQSRKLLSVQIRGKNEAEDPMTALAAEQQEGAPTWGRALKADAAMEITDIYKFKRSQELYASPK